MNGTGATLENVLEELVRRTFKRELGALRANKGPR